LREQDATADMEYLLLKESFIGDVLAVLAATQPNVVFSPHVIATTLNMLRLGSQGETAAEISAVLRSAHPKLLHREPVRPDSSATYLFSSRAWIHAGMVVNKNFMNALRRGESAMVQYVDFVNSTEAARSAMNHAIARDTGGLITEAVPPGSIRQDSRLVLASALYYKGLWSHPFPKSRTRREPFYPAGADQPSIPVPMMRHTMRAEYLRSDGYEAALLAYRDSVLSFGVLMPAESLDDLRSTISSAGLHAMLSDARSCELTIALPRFRVESSEELIPIFTHLGIRSAFDSTADFSPISSQEELRISFIGHTVYVDVDEEGTEAAAVAASGFRPISRQSAEMIVDRPFVFAIIDMESGTTYFLGQVTHPATSL
jgi:serpin B